MTRELKTSIIAASIFYIGIASLSYSEHVLNLVFLLTSIALFIFGIVWSIILLYRWIKTGRNKLIAILFAISPVLLIPTTRIISSLTEDPIFSAEYDGPINGQYLDFYADNSVKYVESSLFGKEIYSGTYSKDSTIIELDFGDNIPDTIVQKSKWKLDGQMLERLEPKTENGILYFYVTKDFGK